MQTSLRQVVAPANDLVTARDEFLTRDQGLYVSGSMQANHRRNLSDRMILISPETRHSNPLSLHLGPAQRHTRDVFCFAVPDLNCRLAGAHTAGRQ